VAALYNLFVGDREVEPRELRSLARRAQWQLAILNERYSSAMIKLMQRQERRF
jgi:hypothetical protein